MKKVRFYALPTVVTNPLLCITLLREAPSCLSPCFQYFSQAPDADPHTSIAEFKLPLCQAYQRFYTIFLAHISLTLADFFSGHLYGDQMFFVLCHVRHQPHDLFLHLDTWDLTMGSQYWISVCPRNSVF